MIRLDPDRLPIRALRGPVTKVTNIPLGRLATALNAVSRSFADGLAPRPAARRAAARQQEVAEAWEELRYRPELTWIPPLWRAESANLQARTIERRHMVSALDRNLKIDVMSHNGAVCIRIATGPLEDRQTSAGADPLAPSAILHPDLDVTATSFEQAVLALRDAARRIYGPTWSTGSPARSAAGGDVHIRVASADGSGGKS